MCTLFARRRLGRFSQSADQQGLPRRGLELPPQQRGSNYGRSHLDPAHI
jgi:hypothetical protein